MSETMWSRNYVMAKKKEGESVYWNELFKWTNFVEILSEFPHYSWCSYKSRDKHWWIDAHRLFIPSNMISPTVSFSLFCIALAVYLFIYLSKRTLLPDTPLLETDSILAEWASSLPLLYLQSEIFIYLHEWASILPSVCLCGVRLNILFYQKWVCQFVCLYASLWICLQSISLH